MAVQDLIEELAQELEDSPKILLSELRKVDADKCLDILDELRESLPIELDRAVRMLKERDQLIGNAEMQAHKIITDAEARAAVIVSQNEIVKAAEQKAQSIIENAQTQAREVRSSAYMFTKGILSDCENYIGGCLEDLHAAREQIDDKEK